MLYETTITKIPLGELAEYLHGFPADKENSKSKEISDIISVLNDRAERMMQFSEEVTINGVDVYHARHIVFQLTDIEYDDDDRTVCGLAITAQDGDEHNIASWHVKPDDDDMLVLLHTEGCCNTLVSIEHVNREEAQEAAQ